MSVLVGQRSIRQDGDGDGDACPAGRPLIAILTCLLHTPALLVCTFTCLHYLPTLVSVSSHLSHPSPAQPSLLYSTRPVEPSRSLSTRNPALINSAIALFNCTADFSGTTQDDSRRLRQSSRASLPGPLFAVINRAGLARTRRPPIPVTLAASRPITALNTDTPVYPCPTRLSDC